MMTEEVWDLMISTYEYERRRTRQHFEEVCKRSSYQLMELRTNSSLQGFIGFWDLGKWVVIEHMAVAKGEQSEKVIPILLLRLLSEVHQKAIVVAETDLILDEVQKINCQLYKNTGFIENPYVYIQPSYHKGMASFPQRLLSYPSSISYEQFKDLRSLLYRFVYGKKKLMGAIAK